MWYVWCGDCLLLFRSPDSFSFQQQGEKKPSNFVQQAYPDARQVEKSTHKHLHKTWTHQKQTLFGKWAINVFKSASIISNAIELPRNFGAAMTHFRMNGKARPLIAFSKISSSSSLKSPRTAIELLFFKKKKKNEKEH